MTAEKEKKRLPSPLKSKISLFLFLFFSVILVFFSQEVKLGFVEGLRLSALSVIPAIFPFFILSDILFAYYEESNGFFERIFESLFKIDRSAYKAFLIGILCGFPLGAKCSSDLYRQGKITSSECERLAAVASSPSFAFVVSGIGIGMKGSLKDGILLYLSVVLSAVLTGILFREKRHKIQNTVEIPKQSFSLVDSIKKASYSSISIASYIVFFSSLLGLVSTVVKNEAAKVILSCFLEVGNASMLVSSYEGLSPLLSFSLLAFALGFSGLSVFMQGAEYLPKEASKTKILFMKLIQGVIAFIVAYIFFYLLF